MKQIWNEIQPVDRYRASSNGLLQDYDQKVISLLYQPLIPAAMLQPVYDTVE